MNKHKQLAEGTLHGCNMNGWLLTILVNSCPECTAGVLDFNHENHARFIKKLIELLDNTIVILDENLASAIRHLIIARLHKVHDHIGSD